MPKTSTKQRSKSVAAKNRAGAAAARRRSAPARQSKTGLMRYLVERRNASLSLLALVMVASGLLLYANTGYDQRRVDINSSREDEIVAQEGDCIITGEGTSECSAEELASAFGPDCSAEGANCPEQQTLGATTGTSGQVFPLVTSKASIRNKSIFRSGTTSRGGHPYLAYDIYVKAGTQVASMTSGKVSKISRDACGGTIVGIYNSSMNRRYSYMHLNPSTLTVRVGTPVSAGKVIGRVGATARHSCNTVDHLHIDAVRGTVRVSCSRSYCPASNQRYFINIGPDLYKTYQKIPN